MGILYMVATPIGNLEDITLRALRVLKEVDYIACEDTRHSRKLLTHFGISKPLISCYAGKEEISSEKILEILRSGDAVAYLSDAGTPGISDPGAVLSAKAAEAGFQVTPLPGASAVTALLSSTGVTGRSFTFDGFLSPKAGKRQRRLKELLDRKENFIFFESPHRIEKCLKDLISLAPERPIIVGRELTKVYEEIIRGKGENVLEFLLENDKIRGEFVVLVSGK